MLLITLLGFFPQPAAALDLKKVPAQFCEQPYQISRHAWNCAGNHKLSEGAEACLEKLNQLEEELGLTAKAIGASGRESQVSEVKTGNAEYGFSVAALAHLQAVAQLAKKELARYPIFISPPDDLFQPQLTGSDPLGWAHEQSCMGGNEKRIGAAQKAIAEKLKHYELRLKEASAYQEKLKKHSTDFNSRNSTAGLTTRHAASAPLKKTISKSKKSSTITGDVQRNEIPY